MESRGKGGTGLVQTGQGDTELFPASGSLRLVGSAWGSRSPGACLESAVARPQHLCLLRPILLCARSKVSSSI